jgi:hypothetical protein
MKPQEFFSPKHLIMPIDVAADLLMISIEELKERIQTEQSDQLALVDGPDGTYVEFKSVSAE